MQSIWKSARLFFTNVQSAWTGDCASLRAMRSLIKGICFTLYAGCEGFASRPSRDSVERHWSVNSLNLERL